MYIYGGKNSARVWYNYLTKGIENIGFRTLKDDEYLFNCSNVIFMFSVNYYVFSLVQGRRAS